MGGQSSVARLSSWHDTLTVPGPRVLHSGGFVIVTESPMTPLDLLHELIAIPSVNPMGRDLPQSITHESRMSEFLVRFFKARSIECERLEVVPGRHNVLARVTGTSGLPTILLDAHQDTVPVDHMTIKPFEPTVRGGRIYGRGACDVKGGMAAMICALERVASHNGDGHPTVILACTCDEELGQLGAADIVKRFNEGNEAKSRLLRSPPDMIIVAEPTELNVAVAHRGVTRWQLRTHGKAAHSSDPSRGENAIYRMAKLVSHLESYAHELGTTPPHPLCGPKTLCVGRIDGGESVNVVPSLCTIEIDRRVVPDEDGPDVIAQLTDYLRARLDFDFEVLPPQTVGLALADHHNRDLAESLMAACDSVTSKSRLVGLPFCTHASRYAAAGVPSVVFGPGCIDQAHTADEWLDLEQLEQASEILFRFLTSWPTGR